MGYGTNLAIPTSAVVPSLVRWGVSPDADLVYRALVTFGAQSPGAAARELGMSPRRVADALEELAAEDAVRRVPTAGRGPGGAESGQWRPLPPEAVVHGLRRRRLRLVDPWERARQHIALVAGLDLTPSADPSRSNRVRLLHGVDQIRERIGELTTIERHEQLSMNPEQAFKVDVVAAASPVDRALLTRGVRLHVLGVPPADGDASAAHGDELARLGGQYRVASQLPVKLFTFDRKVALLPIDPYDTGRAVEIADPAMVRTLVALFLREWEQARDPRRTSPPTVTLTARERALIELLADGHTDATVARRLGLSARTIGYTLRGLMDRLGVENRFQLGLALGAQGVYTRDEPAPARSVGP